MAVDRIDEVQTELGSRIAALRQIKDHLSPLDLRQRMDGIRQAAASQGLTGLAALSRRSAQLALLPGHRVSLESAFDQMADAIACTSDRDTNAMLAALALRLR